MVLKWSSYWCCNVYDEAFIVGQAIKLIDETVSFCPQKRIMEPLILVSEWLFHLLFEIFLPNHDIILKFYVNLHRDT